MAKYNKVKTGPEPVKNHQGGSGMAYKPEYELIALLSTGMENNYYEKETDREKRLIELIKSIGKKDPEFVAKALVYTRSVIGQRSVTHVGAIAAATVLAGNPLGKRFFTKRDRKINKGGIVYRIDDMLEIIAYYYSRNPGKALPNSIKKGFKNVLENADAYELAKYQGKTRNVSLVDLVNMVHPKPSEKMLDTFKKLMTGELKQFGTAEDKNTEAGQKVAAKVKAGEISKKDAAIELEEAKAENWKDLIVSGKLGYLALLRNLRNITNTATDEVFDAAMEMLVDEKRVAKSLVFPHQIDLAFEVLLQEGLQKSGRKTKLLMAINRAYELSIPNLQELFNHGKSAIVFDTSASMTSSATMTNAGKSVNINATRVEKAALVAATLVKGTDATMYHFASYCEKVKYNPLDTVNTIKQAGIGLIGRVGHGTSFDQIFAQLIKDNVKYDRIFIISDMQGGDSLISNSNYQTYVKMFGQPYIYAVDMCGYGTTMFKENQKLIKLFGYSKDIYEQIKVAEISPNEIIKEINKIII